jgi:hydroxymethylpyrimidine/phosphomethylpyrimidine kinase
MTPTVLCFSGLDPSGGAGIQADIETLRATNSRALSIVTALTVQNTTGVREYAAVDAALIYRQATTILEEITPQAIKIGMTANTEIIDVIATICKRVPTIPVVVDPVLSAGKGGTLSGKNHAAALRTHLLPFATVITPNATEFATLLPDPHQCAILKTTTDTHHQGDIEHQLLINDTTISYTYPRLPGSYHGSGCTLASAIAARLAHHDTIPQAVRFALDFTWKILDDSPSTGLSQVVPLR